MALMSSLSRHVFHPLWNLKDGKSRLRILPGPLRSCGSPRGDARWSDAACSA
jgi:hypothetical protein